MTNPTERTGNEARDWSPQALRAWRSVTDPLADETVRVIIESGFEKEVNAIFATLVRSNDFNSDTFAGFDYSLKEILDQYFDKTDDLPEWADPKLIKQGEAFFAANGPAISMLLNVKSLPLCYACAHGAKVLFDTGRLMAKGQNMDPLARRLMETAQMVINAMMPGGLSPKGRGVVTIQKVRLIHASIRYFIKNPQTNPAGWDTAVLGEPINQEDMAGTLMSFSALILDGLKQMHVDFTAQEARAYMHCWAIIGHITGVHPDLIPHSFEEGYELGINIMKDQAAASPQGEALTTSCIRFMQDVIPGNFFDGVPEYMIWYFSQNISEATGKDLASMIGVENTGLLRDSLVGRLTDVFFWAADEASDHSVVISSLMKRFNIRFLQALLEYFNEGKQVRFYIPPSLRQDWKL